MSPNSVGALLMTVSAAAFVLTMRNKDVPGKEPQGDPVD